MRQLSLFSMLLCLSVITASVSAQNSSDTKKLRPSSVEQSKKFNPMNREYLYDTSKILKFFKSGTIPVDFPKATSYKSKKDYKSAALDYAKANPQFFNYEKLAQYGVTPQEQPQKVTLTEQEVRLNKYKRSTPVSEEETQLKELKQQQLLNNK